MWFCSCKNTVQALPSETHLAITSFLELFCSSFDSKYFQFGLPSAFGLGKPNCKYFSSQLAEEFSELSDFSVPFIGSGLNLSFSSDRMHHFLLYDVCSPAKTKRHTMLTWPILCCMVNGQSP